MYTYMDNNIMLKRVRITIIIIKSIYIFIITVYSSLKKTNNKRRII